MRTGIKASNAHLLSRRYIAIKTCMTIKCFPRQNLQHTVIVARAANVGIAVATRPNRLYDSFMAQLSVDARPTSMSRLFKRSSHLKKVCRELEDKNAKIEACNARRIARVSMQQAGDTTV